MTQARADRGRRRSAAGARRALPRDRAALFRHPPEAASPIRRWTRIRARSPASPRSAASCGWPGPPVARRCASPASCARPDFAALKPDLRGLTWLPGAVMAARKGDEALLRFLMDEFEKEGFAIEGAHEVMGELTLAAGPLGAPCAAATAHGADIAKAIEVARAIGALDIGQGAVVCDGLVLAVEAQEGTDAMLRRVAELPAELRGAPGRRRGVLAKVAKPIQEERVDLPTIGLATIEARRPRRPGRHRRRRRQAAGARPRGGDGGRRRRRPLRRRRSPAPTREAQPAAEGDAGGRRSRPPTRSARAWRRR